MSAENKNTPASHGFARYGLSLPILEALEMLGYHHPTAIQQEVIPLVLAGKNVVAFPDRNRKNSGLCSSPLRNGRMGRKFSTRACAGAEP